MRRRLSIGLRRRVCWPALLALAGCGCAATPGRLPHPRPTRPDRARSRRLSQYGLFAGDRAAQQPAAGVIPYDLNSALFSDYAEKFRFIKLPAGTHATYSADDVFDFPVGTVIAKTFAYPRDARDPSKGRRLIETRILKHEPDGWVGLPLRLERRPRPRPRSTWPATPSNVSWIHSDGEAADQQLHHPQFQPVQGLPQAGETMSADRPEGAPPEPRLRLRLGHGKPTDALEPRWGCSSGAPTPRAAPVSPSGTTPRPARSTPGPAPGSRSTAPTATAPKGPRGTRASTCSPRSTTPRPSASTSRRWPPASARAGSPTTSFPASPIDRSSPTASPRPIPAS